MFGLAAADGAVVELATAGIGLSLAAAAPPLPIVPGAILFDLGNEGDKAWGDAPPYHALGRQAARVALDSGFGAPFATGRVGAGRGAIAGTGPGGIGSASLMLEHGLVVGALVAVNPVGWVDIGQGWPGGDDPFPDSSRLAALGRLQPGANTTLAVVACNARIDKVEARRVAIMAQDALARTIRPVHTPFDGDVVFALASGAVDLVPCCDDRRTRPWWLARIGAAAANALARAIVRGVRSGRHSDRASAG